MQKEWLLAAGTRHCFSKFLPSAIALRWRCWSLCWVVLLHCGLPLSPPPPWVLKVSLHKFVKIRSFGKYFACQGIPFLSHSKKQKAYADKIIGHSHWSGGRKADVSLVFRLLSRVPSPLSPLGSQKSA